MRREWRHGKHALPLCVNEMMQPRRPLVRFCERYRAIGLPTTSGPFMGAHAVWGS